MANHSGERQGESRLKTRQAGERSVLQGLATR